MVRSPDGNPNSNPPTTPPPLPTLTAIQRRRDELLATLSPAQRQNYLASQGRAASSPQLRAHPILGEEALHGVAGQLIRTLAPHTEAHPAALLLQLLAAFGNAVGRGPHCMVGAARHSLNLFVILVGDSSKARKGTSWSQIASLLSQADHDWYSTRVFSARLTAPGLVHALRDQQPPTDRRLLVLSEEFAFVLNGLKRTRGQLSPLIRTAWDNGDLPTLDVHNPMQATGTHISLVAHITEGELTENFPHAEARNGFANRCLWTCVQRGNCLPDGGSIDPNDLAPLVTQLRRALGYATALPEMLFRRDAAAAGLWRDHYPALSQVRPGLHGGATSRAEAQVLRLSAIYAALDSTSIIGLPHLQAALAVWKYCSESASLLFGFSTGDPIADRIREAIEASNDGLTRKKIRSLFHGHVERDRIDAALARLEAVGAIRCDRQPTKGRPARDPRRIGTARTSFAAAAPAVLSTCRPKRKTFRL